MLWFRLVGQGFGRLGVCMIDEIQHDRDAKGGAPVLWHIPR